MKKRLFMTGIAACMLVFGTGIYAQQTVSLDNAVIGAAGEFSSNLRRGSKIAILAVRSDSARMSNYIIEELTSAMVSQRSFTVVDRAQLDLIQQEMSFQLSGEVSDSSAQAIGQKLGAQAIVTGTFELIGNYYRLRVRVIEVESAAILAIYSANVQNDHVVASLMGSGRSSPASLPVPSASDSGNFTTGQRWGTWALNGLLPGLGSYAIMKDARGGTTQVILGGGGLLLFLGGLGFYSIGIEGGWDDGIIIGSIMMFPGGGLLLSSGIYNIVRSVRYNKPLPPIGSLADPDAWSLAILPGANGVERVQLAYTLRY